jgi:hypothetical protein
MRFSNMSSLPPERSEGMSCDQDHDGQDHDERGNSNLSLQLLQSCRNLFNLFLPESLAIACSTTMDPPAYDGSADTSPAHGGELPAYTRRPTPPIAASVTEPKQFTYGIKNRTGGAPWASLIVDGDSRLSKAEPTIIQGSKFAGSVKLTLQKPETTQAVFILVRRQPLRSVEGAHDLFLAPGRNKAKAGCPADYLLRIEAHGVVGQ